MSNFDPTGSSDNFAELNASLTNGGVTTLTGPGAYKCLSPITINNNAKLVIEPGAHLDFPVGAQNQHMVTVIGGTVEGEISGPGAAATSPNGILARDKALLRDCSPHGFAAGINIIGNHQRFYSIKPTSNYVNVYFGPGAQSFGDQTFIDADMTGASLASIAVDPSNTIDNAEFIGGHVGWAPYGIYRPSAGYGVGKQFITSTRFVGFAFETIGNGFIFDESKSRDVSDCTFLGAGASWADMKTNPEVRLATAGFDYGIDVGTLMNTDIHGVTTFQDPGNLGVIRAVLWQNSTWHQAKNVITNCKATKKSIAAPKTTIKGVYLIGEDGRYVTTSFQPLTR